MVGERRPPVQQRVPDGRRAEQRARRASNNIAYVPIVDAVQEFSVQQNSYDAQYGKTGGGVFNVVLKSGRQRFHGIRLGVPAPAAAGRQYIPEQRRRAPRRPDHYLDQYGFQVDGPVYIPKLLKKDAPVKLFYLGSFENYREKWPQFLRNSYPEPEMRNGDFSKLCNAIGPGRSRSTTRYDYSLDANGNPVRRPFPGNIIPAQHDQPDGQGGDRLHAAPNAPTPGGSRYSNQQPSAARVRGEGQVLQPDPEVRLELRRQAPRLLPSRIERPDGRPRRQRHRQHRRARTASSRSSGSTTPT